MRRLSYWLIALCCLTAGALWLTETLTTRWGPAITRRIERQATRIAGGKVLIGRVSLWWLHRIDVHQMRLLSPNPEDPPLFQAERLSLKISWLDLPRALLHRDVTEALGILHLERPRLDLSQPHAMRFASLNRRSARSLPLFFTLRWNDGSLRYRDPSRISETVLASHVNGLFKIRGPRVSLDLAAQSPLADGLRIEFSQLGKRWSLRTVVRQADLARIQSTVSQWASMPASLDGWSIAGRASLDLTMSSRERFHWPVSGRSIRRQGALEIHHASLQGPGRLPFSAEGRWSIRDSMMETRMFQVTAASSTLQMDGRITQLDDAPRVDLTARADSLDLHTLLTQLQGASVAEGRVQARLQARGPITDPSLQIDVSSPKGKLWNLPYESLSGQIVRMPESAWRVQRVEMLLAGGKAALIAHGSAHAPEWRLTLDSADLGAWSRSLNVPAVQGRLNATAQWRGSLRGGSGSGAFWVQDWSWEGSSPVEAKGDFEILPSGFKAQARSDRHAFRAQIQGTRSAQAVRLDLLDVRFPGGAAIQGQGHRRSNGAVDLRLTATGIRLPEDVPPLSRIVPGLQTQVQWDAHITRGQGPWNAQGTVQTDPLQIRGRSTAALSARWEYSPDRRGTIDGSLGDAIGFRIEHHHPDQPWEVFLQADQASLTPVEAFSPTALDLDGLISGRLQLRIDRAVTGYASATVTNALLHGQHIPEANVDLSWNEGVLTAHRLYARTPWAIGDFQGHLRERKARVWGRAYSTEGASLWEIPLVGSAQWSSPSASPTTGQLSLHAETVRIRGKPTEPLMMAVTWDGSSWRWDQTRWGTAWASHGRILVSTTPALIEAQITARHVPPERWSGWIKPSWRENLTGSVSGTLDVKGSLVHPEARLDVALESMRWRSIGFRGRLLGTWNKQGIQPITLDGDFESGGQFTFNGGYRTDSASLHGSLRLDSLPLSVVGTSLGLPKPLGGLVHGTLTAGGTTDSLQWTGHLEGQSMTYGFVDQNPLRLEHFDLDVTAAPSLEKSQVWRISLAQGEFRTAEERIRFQKGSFIEVGSKEPSRLLLRSEIRNLGLGPVRLFGGLDLDGTWQIRDAGIALTGHARTRSLFINDYELQQGSILASYYDRVIRFAPSSDGTSLIEGTIDFTRMPQLRFDQFRIAGKHQQGLLIDGEIGPTTWDFTLDGRRVDLATLSGLAGFPYRLTGTADAVLRGTGDLRRPQVQGRLQVSNGEALGLQFVKGQARFLWRNDRISFQALEISYPGRYTLRGSGGIPITPPSPEQALRHQDRTIDFTLRLDHSNLGFVQSLMPDIKEAKGAMQGIIQITGTLDHPQWRGSLRVDGGSLTNAHYFKRLEDIQLDADLVGNALRLHTLSGRSGRGVIQASGAVQFTGFQPSAYDLKAQTIGRQGIDIQVPELEIPESPLAKRLKFLRTTSYATIAGSVTFRGPAEQPTFGGEASITNGTFSFPPYRRTATSAAGRLAWFSAIRWDVLLRFFDGAWFENEYVAANLLGQLRLNGPRDRLQVDGGLDVLGGRVDYLGLRFDIAQARFDLRSSVDDTGHITNIPYLRASAQSRTQSVDTQTRGVDLNDTITLTIDYAPLNEIKPRLTSLSNPGLSQEKLLARAGNLDVENLTPQERNQLYQQQMVRVLDASLATPLARTLLRKIGLSIRSERLVDPGATQAPTTTGAETAASREQTTAINLLANSKYTIEATLWDRLSLGYGVRFVPTTTDTLQNRLDLINDLQLSYRWFRNVYVKGSFDLPNANAGSGYIPDRKVTIEPQWRFPWTFFRKKDKPKKPADSTGTPPAASEN